MQYYPIVLLFGIHYLRLTGMDYKNSFAPIAQNLKAESPMHSFEIYLVTTNLLFYKLHESVAMLASGVSVLL